MKNLFFLLTSIVFFLSVNYSYSQDLKSLEQLNDQTAIGLMFTHPSFPTLPESTEFSITSGIYELYGIIKINENLRLIANLPYSTYSANSISKSGIGNVSLGLKYLFGNNQNMTVSGLIYIPTSSDNDYIANSLSNEANLWDLQKYRFDITTIHLNFNIKAKNNKGLFYGGGIGNRLLIYTGKRYGGDHDVDDIIEYFAGGGYEKINSIGWEIQFAGMYAATSESKDGSNNFVQLLKLGLSYHNESIKPKLFMVFPVGNVYSNMISNLIGIELQFYLK